MLPLHVTLNGTCSAECIISTVGISLKKMVGNKKRTLIKCSQSVCDRMSTNKSQAVACFHKELGCVHVKHIKLALFLGQIVSLHWKSTAWNKNKNRKKESIWKCSKKWKYLFLQLVIHQRSLVYQRQPSMPK